MSTNIYRRLLHLLPRHPVLVATVGADYGDGTALVVLDHGGGQARVKNPLALVMGAHVYVQDGAITGPAPLLEAVLIEV